MCRDLTGEGNRREKRRDSSRGGSSGTGRRTSKERWLRIFSSTTTCAGVQHLAFASDQSSEQDKTRAPRLLSFARSPPSRTQFIPSVICAWSRTIADALHIPTPAYSLFLGRSGAMPVQFGNCPSKERADSGERWLLAPDHTRDNT